MNEPKGLPYTMTKEDLARNKGRRVFKPYVTEDGKHMVTRDGMLYHVLPDGSVRRLVDTPRRMSKKERRKWREEQELQEVAAYLKVQQDRIKEAILGSEKANGE